MDSDRYRYSFQGQENDDEVKGEGNSYSYKYRMHDPRIGRLFAVDPLTHRYSFLTPYQFSSNKVISHIELKGLEGYEYIKVYEDLDEIRHQKMTKEEIEREYFIQNMLWAGTGAIIVDALVTKGRATQFLVRQAAAQTVVNVTVNATVATFSSELEFDPATAVAESFTGFDFADTGMDAGMQLLAKKYKIGYIQKIVETVAPTLFDVTYEEGVQIVGINKDADKILTDLMGNVVTNGIESKLEANGLEIPTIKLLAAKEAEVLGGAVLELLEIQIRKWAAINNLGKKTDQNDQIKAIETKVDNLRTSRREIIDDRKKEEVKDE